MDRRGVALRASAAAAAALVLAGGIAFALHSSPSAQAVAEPSSPASVAVSTSPGVSIATTVDSAGHTVLTTSTAPLPPGRDVLVLGDSLGLDIYAWLADLLPDRYVAYAAVVGRDTPSTYTALQQIAHVPPVVLVSLGTNDLDAGPFRRAAESILTALGPDRCVVWSDVVRPESIGNGSKPINDVIDDLARSHSNVRLFRWSALVAQHPDWLSGDGIHPGQEGAQARAQGFADAALACSPLDAAAPRASRDYLPPSAFNGPGGTSVQVGRTPTVAPVVSSHAATPTGSGSPTRSSSAGHSPSAGSSAPKTSAPPSSTTPTTTPTVTPSEPAPSGSP